MGMSLARLSLVASVLMIVMVASVGQEASGEAAYCAYDGLSDEQKAAYDSLYGVVSSMGPRCDMSGLTIEEGEGVRYALLSDHPELFWFDGEYSLYVYKEAGMASSIDHTGALTLSEAESMSRQMRDVADSIKASGPTEADRIRSIHDAVAFRAVYDKSAEHCGNAYGALVEGKAKCDGYSYAFNYLCRMNGISSLCIVGTADGEKDGGHAWNMVRTGGSWYYVDVTWDDIPCPECAVYDYFLIGSDTDTPTGRFSSSRTAVSEYGAVPSESSYGYDPYRGETYTVGAWIGRSAIAAAGNTVTSYFINIGAYRLSYDASAMKALAGYMEKGGYEKWAVSVTRGPAQDGFGMSSPFSCTVGMYLDEEPVSLSAMGLSGRLFLQAPGSTDHPDYLTDAYWGGERISHGAPFGLKETGTYTVGYVEKTFFERWGMAMAGLAFIATFLVFLTVYRRRHPAGYVPDYEGSGTVRRFDRDSVCPECGNEVEPDAEFCPYCGRRYRYGLPPIPHVYLSPAVLRSLCAPLSERRSP